MYMVFVDFSKAFDRVGMTGHWQLLGKYGCPEKFRIKIESLHTGMMANVSTGGEISVSLNVTNGVKQSCVHALLLLLPISNARRGLLNHGGWRLHIIQTER